MARFSILFVAANLAFSVAHGADEFSTSVGPLTMTPIRHASLMIQANGITLYLDPAQGRYDGLPKADYILITDIHDDHLSPASIDKVKKKDTRIIAPKAVAEQLAGDALDVRALPNGEKTSAGPFAIEAVPMYNVTRGPATGKFYHDKGRGNGYVISYGGKRIYFSGDTEAIPEMKSLRNIDIAFVCMNLPYTMPPSEAAIAVRRIHPSIVYPYHYLGSDLNVFAKALEGSGIEVRLRNWYPE